MCGRYSFFLPMDEASRLLDLRALPNPDWFPHYNAAPTQGMPVVTNEFPGVIQFFRWGLVPKWATEPSIGYKMINTRAESIIEKPAFRNIFKYKRCIVLADGYYEWKAAGENEMAARGKKNKAIKQPYRFYVPGNEIIMMAGLWDTWGPENLQTFSIITCAANSDTAPLHDRMPVILGHNETGKWLANNTPLDELIKLLKPAPEGLLEAYPISTYLNKPGNEGPQVLERVTLG